MKIAFLLSAVLLFAGCASHSDKQAEHVVVPEKANTIPERARFALAFMETIAKENFDTIGTAERLKFISREFLAENNVDVSEAEFNRHEIGDFEFASMSGEYVDIEIRVNLADCKRGDACWTHPQSYYRFKVINEAGGFALVPYLYKAGSIYPWRAYRKGASGFVDTSMPSSPEREAFALRFIETELESAESLFTDEDRFSYFSEEHITKYGVNIAAAKLNSFSRLKSVEVLNSFGEFVDIELNFDNPYTAHETRVARFKVIEEDDGFALEPQPIHGKLPSYISPWWVFSWGAYDL